MIIDETTVKKLIADQFKEYRELEIKKIKLQGHDNTTFKLGADLLIAFPNGPQYAKRVSKYYHFLPEVQKKVSIRIPQIVHVGEPADLYPYQWTIGKWIEGVSTNFLIDSIDLSQFAFQLASELKSFKEIYFDSIDMIPSQDNWWRGGDLRIYHGEVIDSLKILGNSVDGDRINKIFSQALASKWQGNGIFVHGDIALGNSIYKDNALFGLIDFGTMVIGDPACDLMIAYTVFEGSSRKIFQDTVQYDKDTWMRAMGWTLWKAVIELAAISKSQSRDWQNPMGVINSIIKEYESL